MALINVIDGGVTKRLQNGVPYKEGGVPAVMEESELQKRNVFSEDSKARYYAVEYWRGDELMHRSCHVDMKPEGMPKLFAEQGEFH